MDECRETTSEDLLTAAADKRAHRMEGRNRIIPKTEHTCDFCNKGYHSRVGLLGHACTRTHAHTHAYTHAYMVHIAEISVRYYIHHVNWDECNMPHYLCMKDDLCLLGKPLLKLKFSQYPSIHTNYIISHCTTL